jgi:hypothetical protein
MRREDLDRFRRPEIIPDLPWRYGSPGGPMPKRLAGATIVAIGTSGRQDVDGGGLFLDYIPRGESSVRRIVFAFNEAGMWIEYQGMIGGPIPKPTIPARSQG